MLRVLQSLASAFWRFDHFVYELNTPWARFALYLMPGVWVDSVYCFAHRLGETKERGLFVFSGHYLSIEVLGRAIDPFELWNPSSVQTRFLASAFHISHSELSTNIFKHFTTHSHNGVMI